MSAREQNELQQVKNLLTEERTKRESMPSPTFPSFLPSSLLFLLFLLLFIFIYLVLELEEELKSSLAELEMAKSAAPPPTDNSAILEEKNE